MKKIDPKVGVFIATGLGDLKTQFTAAKEFELCEKEPVERKQKPQNGGPPIRYHGGAREILFDL